MEARNCRSDRRETGTQIGQIGKTENPLVFFAKTENQMLIRNGKSANHNELQNRKTGVFWHKNRKTDLKHGQNRKIENPSAPLLYQLYGFRISLIGDVTPSDGSSNFFLISPTISLFLGVRTRDDFINIIKTAVCVSSIYIQMTPICIWMKITFIT